MEINNNINKVRLKYCQKKKKDRKAKMGPTKTKQLSAKISVLSSIL